MLLTSYKQRQLGVSKIIEMGPPPRAAMRVYTPERPMGHRGSGYPGIQTMPQVPAPPLVKADHYQAVDLTLHVIYGHLTWMATYEPEGSSPSFVGIGFVDAYRGDGEQWPCSAAASRTRCRTTSPSSPPRAPPTGQHQNRAAQYQTITGKIAAIGWDITGGQKYWYLTLAGQPGHAYVGNRGLRWPRPSSSPSPATRSRLVS